MSTAKKRKRPAKKREAPTFDEFVHATGELALSTSTSLTHLTSRVTAIEHRLNKYDPDGPFNRIVKSTHPDPPTGEAAKK